MKTLMIVTGGLGTGGLERISCFVANKFCEKGWKVVILTLLQMPSKDKTFQILNNDVDVIHFEGDFDPLFHKYKAIKVWKKMIKKYTNQYRPDSILAMTFKIGSMICLFAPKMANRVTVREISDPKSKVRNQFVNRLTEHFCRNIKNVIFQTNWEQSCYHKKIQNKGVVIPNPLSIIINNHGSYKMKKFFTLSRLLINQKRQDVLVKAFALFHNTHPDYELEIYGKGDDKQIILKLIEEVNGQEYMHIFDPIPNIHEKVIDHRCFVMTSDFEGMSNALLECYSLGIPCISSDWPGVEDIVSNGVDGLIYKRQDVKQLAELMANVAEDDKLCSAITKNAIKNSYRFDENDVISRYCEVIEHE